MRVSAAVTYTGARARGGLLSPWTVPAWLGGDYALLHSDADAQKTGAFPVALGVLCVGMQ